MSRNPDRIVVIGGGVIGLSCAWRLLRAGFSVTVVDAGSGERDAASRVAAGMLAPVAEYGFDDDAFLELGVHSLASYPQFLADLEEDSGARVALDTTGTLVVGLDRDDIESIRRVHRFRESRGLPVQWITAGEAREIEPALTPRVAGGMWIPGDGQIDNRALLDALRAGVIARGGESLSGRVVQRIRVDAGHVTAVVIDDEIFNCDAAVNAAGCWSPSIAGIENEVCLPVRPVKGQIVRLRGAESCPLRTIVRAPDIYLLPKRDGSIVVGATEEEMGFDRSATAGGVLRLLERAWEVVPSIYDLSIDTIEVGLRPGSRDHLPIIGPTGVGGLVVATGHYRHGILLAPATADIVVRGFTDGFSENTNAFSPKRFSATNKNRNPRNGTSG